MPLDFDQSRTAEIQETAAAMYADRLSAVDVSLALCAFQAALVHALGPKIIQHPRFASVKDAFEVLSKIVLAPYTDQDEIRLAKAAVDAFKRDLMDLNRE